MIAGDVGEYGNIKVHVGSTVLHQGVGTHFHEAVFHTCIDHGAHVALDGQCIWCGVGGWNGFAPHFNVDGAEQATLFAFELGEQGVQ